MKKLKEAIRKFTEDEDLEDFILKWTEKNGSAVDVWGKKALWQKIKDLSDKGTKFSAVVYDTTGEDAGDVKDEIKKMKAKGWSVVDQGDNYEQTEVIYAK